METQEILRYLAVLHRELCCPAGRRKTCEDQLSADKERVETAMQDLIRKSNQSEEFIAKCLRDKNRYITELERRHLESLREKLHEREETFRRMWGKPFKVPDRLAAGVELARNREELENTLLAVADHMLPYLGIMPGGIAIDVEFESGARTEVGPRRLQGSRKLGTYCAPNTVGIVCPPQSTIRSSPPGAGAKRTIAVLAHELCHHFLFSNGIHDLGETIDMEVLTDLTCQYLNLGRFQIDGYALIAEEYEQAGYLPLKDLKLAGRFCGHLRKVATPMKSLLSRGPASKAWVGKKIQILSEGQPSFLGVITSVEQRGRYLRVLDLLTPCADSRQGLREVTFSPTLLAKKALRESEIQL
jgi:hypothetical protein